MTWTESDVPDQSGRVALITGANGGLGRENARALAAKNAIVIMAVRDQDKAAIARRDIEKAHPDARLDVRGLDLASLESIHGLADRVVDEYDRLDILINNAGVMAIPERRTADGFEMQFGTNHLGHHALTSRLLPLLVGTPGSRVVTVTSTARHFGRPVDPANPHLDDNYDRWRAYGQSKLANLHFALGLEQRLRSAAAPTSSLVAHPGLTYTDLQENTAREGGGDVWARLTRRFGMRPPRGALPQLRAATDPQASGAQLYAPRWVNFGPPVRRPLIGPSRNRSAIDKLFAISASETGLDIDVAAAMS